MGRRWAVISRIITFWAGLAGVGYETLYEDVDRPWLLFAFLTMMGLTQFARVFEMLHRDDGVTITFGKSSTKPGSGPGPGPPKEKTESKT